MAPKSDATVTTREYDVVVALVKSLKNVVIDFDRFAELGGYKDGKSARTGWHNLKKKLEKLPGGEIGSATAATHDAEPEEAEKPALKKGGKKSKAATAAANASDDGKEESDEAEEKAAPKSVGRKRKAAAAAAEASDDNEEVEEEKTQPKKGRKGGAKKKSKKVLTPAASETEAGEGEAENEDEAT